MSSTLLTQRFFKVFVISRTYIDHLYYERDVSLHYFLSIKHNFYKFLVIRSISSSYWIFAEKCPKFLVFNEVIVPNCESNGITMKFLWNTMNLSFVFVFCENIIISLNSYSGRPSRTTKITFRSFWYWIIQL